MIFFVMVQNHYFLRLSGLWKIGFEIAAEIVLGMVEACKDNNCALIGGETAEMPGMYQPGDYDVAGFCVGIVEKDQIIDGSKSKQETKLLHCQVQDSIPTDSLW
jgi:phosphoribosylformylglycinamidine cyclo-ligase